MARRRGKPLNEVYVDYLAQEGAHKLVVAIAYKNLTALADAGEANRMELRRRQRDPRIGPSY